MAVYPPRSKVQKKQTWNAESVFKNERTWQDELNKVLARSEFCKAISGKVGRRA